MKEKDCFLFGTIFKLHGYKGHINIYSHNAKSTELSSIQFIYILIDSELIPYFIESIQIKKKHTLLVKLEDVDSQKEAQNLLKKNVFIHNKFLKKNDESTIEGFTVLDKKIGIIGIVNRVNSQSPQKLLEVINNEKRKIMIPYHPEFIVKIEIETQNIIVDIDKELMHINYPHQ